ncbi:MAG: undecaprenyl-phosphate glucose phosphotransferase [Steroidobacteraceae bacterium]
MLDVQPNGAQPLRIQPGPTALLRAMLDPLIADAVLLATVVWFHGRIEGPYLILALLMFSIAFPSQIDWTAPSASLLRNILADWLAIVGLLLLLGWASRTLAAFDQRVILVWLFATPLAILAARSWLPALLAQMRAQGLHRTAVIAGANDLGRRLAEHFNANPMLGIRHLGFFDDRDAGRIETAPAGSLRELAAFVKAHHVDVIYIALPMCSQPRIRQLLDDLHDTTASIYFVPDVLLFDLIQGRIELLGELPVVAVCESPFYGVNGIVKRASDIALGSVLLAMAAPLLLAIAIGVRLSSPGPVLFRQRRYGLDGREIVVYKFRTMTCVEDGLEIRQATADDARITRLGAILRRYSLNELPQFVNVLQGRMSVVGPRPHAVAHNEMYRKLIRGYMIRHKVRPGLTGLAQVRGLRGETDTLDKMQARVACDLDYLRHWSLLLDLRIVLRTVGVVLARKNAH